jgi:2'-5' RNA ligase
MALQSNLALRELSQKEEIDFFTKHTPHITLYQADLDFNNTDVVSNATVAAIGNLTPPCLISWPSHAVVSGDYAMYIIPYESCLQSLSNKLVMALKGYVHRPPRVPDWVYSLPRKERRRALELIDRYGSPNVMDRFQPHVTVGFDKVYPPYRRGEALKELITPPSCQARLAMVTIARVGEGGSVSQNGVLARIPLYVKSDPNGTTASVIS